MTIACMARSSHGGRILYARVSCLIGTCEVNRSLQESDSHGLGGTLCNMRAKFGLSLSTRAVLFGWGTLDDLLVPQTAEAWGILMASGLAITCCIETASRSACDAVSHCRAHAAGAVGTICLASFPLRDPLLLALQWASLDLLSHGRTVLAVCIGGGPDGPQFAHELDVMGVNPERVGRLVEGVTLLRRLWAEERVTH